jgi:hypothetical protein
VRHCRFPIADCQFFIPDECSSNNKPQSKIGNRQLEIDNAKRIAPPILTNWRDENIRVGSGLSGVARQRLENRHIWPIPTSKVVLSIDGGIKSAAGNNKSCRACF